MTSFQEAFSPFLMAGASRPQVGMFSSASQSTILTTSLIDLSESRELSVWTVFSGLYCQEFTHFTIGNFQVLIIVTAVHFKK